MSCHNKLNIEVMEDQTNMADGKVVLTIKH